MSAPKINITRITDSSTGSVKTVYSRAQAQEANANQAKQLAQNAFSSVQPTRSTLLDQSAAKNHIPTQANPAVSVQEAAKHVDMSQAISIDLPSRFKFYTFKDLYVKPMRNHHRAKLAAAYQQQAVRPVVEVIDSLLSTSTGETCLAYKLTEPDFTYLMYWIRLHFFMTTPFTVRTACKNPEHIKQVESGEKRKASLEIVQTLNSLVPESKFIDENYEPDFSEFIPTFEGLDYVPEGISVGAATYGDIVELTEDDHFMMEQTDPATGKVEKVPNTAYLYLVNAAAYLHGPGLTLRDRVKMIGNMDEQDYTKLINLGKSIPNYGVNEVITVRCKECGATRRVRVRLDAHSFFPDL